jgi:3-hydroxybutyryl-CoA dehydrogenase
MPQDQITAVVGAGVMGQGVAQALAQSGHRVILVDISKEVLQRARDQLAKTLRFRSLFEKTSSLEPAEVVLERIQPTIELEDAARASFVVENVTEKWDIKKPVYQRLDAACPPETVFAANTSAISITRIGSATRRPAQVVGMHFMNPVPLKPVVEVIRGFHTSEDTLGRARSFLASMGKEAIVVEDAPGFVSNRVLMLTINEAIFLVHERVAAPAEVDRIFKACFGHKMGPLETGDLIGLDTILLSLEVLGDSFGDPKFRPCPLLRKMVDAGLHGRKSGEGFFRY